MENYSYFFDVIKNYISWSGNLKFWGNTTGF